ncbi:hypothetical protein FACS1894172_03210 [Spirochaetia bacterium]|nr:hypothetical protein FACS1894172_03210 [Spirochaetia bacterium]
MASGIMENDWMFSGRGVVPWHEIGTVLDGVPSSREAIKAAKLEWTVNQTPVFAVGNLAKEISGFKVNVR